MDANVLDHIPFVLDEAELLQRLRIRPDRPEVGLARELAAEAQALARPRAMYRLAFVESCTEDQLVVNGVRLTSRVLRVNLDNVHRVFAFVATSGVEIESWLQSKKDLLESYYADAIAEMSVRAALAALDRHLRTAYDLAPLSMMNPGSLADWPLSQQRALFNIVGDTESTIGVQLTSSYLMVPRKTVSGIQFPAQEGFASCQLCPRPGCPNRRAPYDKELFDRKYSLASKAGADKDL